MANFATYSVLGGGSWGTAIASFLARSTGSSTLYTIEESVKNQINNHRLNSKYLPNIELPKTLTATNNLKEAIQSDVIVIAVSSFAFLDLLQQLKNCNLPDDKFLLIATKGLVDNPVELFSERIKKLLNNNFGFLSGPNLAREIAENKLAAITISSENTLIAKNIAKDIESETIKTSVSDDIITCQIAAIVKNIIAIKSGIMKAEEQGENALAYIITKALEEIGKISGIFGGKKESLILPSITGDLVLTCYSDKSRNNKFGYELCQNNFDKEFLENYPTLVEGVHSARLLKQLLAKHNLDIPLINSIIQLLD